MSEFGQAVFDADAQSEGLRKRLCCLQHAEIGRGEDEVRLLAYERGRRLACLRLPERRERRVGELMAVASAALTPLPAICVVEARSVAHKEQSRA